MAHHNNTRSRRQAISAAQQKQQHRALGHNPLYCWSVQAISLKQNGRKFERHCWKMQLSLSLSFSRCAINEKNSGTYTREHAKLKTHVFLDLEARGWESKWPAGKSVREIPSNRALHAAFPRVLLYVSQGGHTREYTLTGGTLIHLGTYTYVFRRRLDSARLTSDCRRSAKILVSKECATIGYINVCGENNYARCWIKWHYIFFLRIYEKHKNKHAIRRYFRKKSAGI